MTSLRRVTCVLINETSSSIIATGSTLNYKIQEGVLAGAMPCPIAPDAKRPFSMAQAEGSTVGPSGWACYELEFKSLVYQIGFGDPALGAGSFTIGANYLDKLGEAVTSVSFAGPSGPIDASKVAQEMDLTVEYHLGFKPLLQVAGPPNASVQASQPVAAPPDGSAAVVIPAFIHRWDDKRMTQKRKKVLAAIGKLYPMLWQEKGDTAVRTAAIENGGGTYHNKGPWTDKLSTSCTSSCPMVGNAVSPKSGNKWTFQAYTAKAGWTVWGSNTTKKMPSVGDVYLLYRDEITRPLPPKPAKPDGETADAATKAEWRAYWSKVAQQSPHLRHVGIIVQVPTSPSEFFVTADGGQRAFSVQAAHLAKRVWKQRKPGPSDSKSQEEWKKVVASKDHKFAQPIDGIDCAYLAGGAESKDPADGNRLVGWIDIDALEFTDEAFDATYTEADYKALGARIDGIK